MHLDPHRLVEVVGDEANLGQLAHEAGLEPRVLREARLAERRLDRPALRRIAKACQLSDEELSCRYSRHQKDISPCPACDAPNEIDDRLLGPAAERVTAFLVAARRSVPGLQRDAQSLTPQAWTASPELFARGPEFAAAATALQRLGGDLTADDLAQTGVAALLGSDKPFNLQEVGLDLARYAARGDVERLELMGLNVCDLPDGPIPFAGWELVRLGRRGVRDLMPVPAAADFAPQPGWNLTAAEATWWLRRSTGREARRSHVPVGLLARFWARTLHECAVEPLTVLALADDAPLQPLSYYVIDRGVAIHRIKGRDLNYDWASYGPSEQDMRPQFHDHEYYAHFGGSRTQEEWSKWQRFCEVVGTLVDGAYQKKSTDPDHRGVDRLIRAADHFLNAVVDANPTGLPQQRTVLELSIALEVLLVTGDSGLSRKFRNRAACLGGRDEAERESIRKHAEVFYKAGSDYRHGGELWSLYDSRGYTTTSPQGEKSIDVAECRKLARKLLLHGLALLGSGTSMSVADLCAEALCQVGTGTWMTNVIDELYSRLEDWQS